MLGDNGEPELEERRKWAGDPKADRRKRVRFMRDRYAMEAYYRAAVSFLIGVLVGVIGSWIVG